MRPALVPEIRLLGLVVVRKARGRGSGYAVGEPYPRNRRGGRGEGLVRVAYYPTAGEALLRAVWRARDLAGGYPRAPGARELLGATAGLYQAALHVAAATPELVVLEARNRAGLTQAGLARAAGCSRTTVRDVEAGRVRPNIATVARLLDACRQAKKEPQYG